MLKCAEGLTSKEVAQELGHAEHTVGKWRRRFAEHRIEGLSDEYRAGRLREISNAQVAEIIKQTLESEAWSAQPMRSSGGRLQAPNTEGRDPLVDPFHGH